MPTGVKNPTNHAFITDPGTVLNRCRTKGNLTAVSGIKRKSKENVADDVENTPSWEQRYKSVTLLFN